MSELFDNDPLRRQACISTSGNYRWMLARQWGPLATPCRTIVFIMLNPSIADAKKDDPTIRRCIGFAKENDCNSLIVLNLFAYRATVPSECFAQGKDAIGYGNDAWLVEHTFGAAFIVAAWGVHGSKFGRDKEVLRLLEAEGRGPIYCLGITQEGHPKHPLYLKCNTPLVPFERANALS